LARCDVLRLTANRRVNDKERLPSLGSAGEAYVAYLESSPGGDRVAKAQSNLGTLAKIYGETLVRMIETDDIGDQRADSVATAETIFKSSLKGMNELIGWWEALPDSDPQKNATQFTIYYPNVFNRALVYLSWAQLYPVGSIERDQRAKQAVGYLETFAIGAPFLPSQRAYKALADCYNTLGELENAFDYYEYVSLNVKDLISQEENLDPLFIEQLHDVIQESDYGMLKMLSGSGQVGLFWQTYDAFNDWVDEERIELSRNGYELQLVVAAQMVAEGQVGEAISLADEVAKANSRSTLRLRANAVMGDAIALAPPDADIPLDVLYGSAEGAYYQKDYSAAVDGFRLLIPRLAGSREADDYGAKAYYFLGLSWTRLQQPMLAAVTHQIGYEDYPDHEEYAVKNAEKWQSLASGFFAKNNTDGDLQTFNDAAIAAVGEAGGGGKDLQWDQAKTLNRIAKQEAAKNPKAASGSPEAKKIVAAYAAAILGYDKVPPESSNYEKALLASAICEYESIRFDEAATDRSLTALESYLAYSGDPANAPEDPRQRKIRRESEPQAVFYLGRTWREIGKSGDPSAWQKVLDTYEGMLERYPDQTELGYAGLSYRVEAFVRQGRIEEAEAEYQAMLAIPATKSRLAVASFTLYLHYRGVEADQIARQKEAEYLSSYNTFSTVKRWTNLLGEADLWAALGDFEKSTVLYETVLDKHSEDQGFDDAFRFKTQMGLVESYLQLRRIGEAVPLVDALHAQKPKNLRVRTAVVKVKAGFLVYDGNQVLEVPGEGTSEALELATTMATELINVAKFEAGKQSPPLNHYFYAPWWEAKLNQAYVLYQRGKTNPADLGKHKSLVESLQKQAPDLGESVAGERMSQSLRWLLNH
ncbi:MAG: tetratricopeptide repeat protein, partial [Planctomycetota bacterium]